MTFPEAYAAGLGGAMIRRRAWPATTSDFRFIFVVRGMWRQNQFTRTNNVLTSRGQDAVVNASGCTYGDMLADDWQTEEDYNSSPTPPATTPLPSPPQGQPGTTPPAAAPVAARIDLRALSFEAGISTNRYALYVIPQNGGAPYSIGFLVIKGKSLVFQKNINLTLGDTVEVVGIGTLRSIPWTVKVTTPAGVREYSGGGFPWSIRTPHVSYVYYGRSAGTFPLQ